MSAAAAAPTAEAGAAAPVKKGKKKLIIIALIAVLVLAAAGGGALFFLKKKKAAAEAEGAEETTSAHAEHGSKPDLKHPPTFLPLDPFVVNLADKESDRYAQVGITLEVEDAKFADQMKAFMPAIRNSILMILAHKTSRELLDRAGKEQLALEILRESARTMGIDVGEPEPAEHAEPKAEKVEKTDKTDAEAEDEDKPKAKAKPKAKKKAPAEPNPIKHVHFSNFIVQ